MSLPEIKTIIEGLSPPCDEFLVSSMIDEFQGIENRYIQGDWGPTQLEAGRFCEAVSRIIYHLDSGNLSLKKGVDPCLKYIENEQVKHNLVPRRSSLHLAATIRLAYKFRSQRGAVHLSADYTANEMDSKFVLETVRWIFSDLLRLLWEKDEQIVAAIVRQVIRFDIPVIRDFNGVLLIQRTDLSAEEEILLLLHYSGEEGMSRRELGKHIMHAPSTITSALKKLSSKQIRQIIDYQGKCYLITDLGEKRIRTDLFSKISNNST